MYNFDFSEHLYYDPLSPSGLRWRTDRMFGRKKSRVLVEANSVAGSLRDNGYWYVHINRKIYSAHRVVMILNDILPDVVDHKHGQSGGNNIENLRSVTHTINKRNKGKSKNNSSGVTGVKWEYGTNKKAGRKPILYAVAFWRDSVGKSKCKNFRVDTYGLLPAFQMAVLHRQKAIEERNREGAGYTERHGN